MNIVKTKHAESYPMLSISMRVSPKSVLASSILAKMAKADDCSISILRVSSSPRSTLLASLPVAR